MFRAAGLHESLQVRGLSGYDCPIVEDATESYFLQFQGGSAGHADSAGRDRRLDTTSCAPFRQPAVRAGA